MMLTRMEAMLAARIQDTKQQGQIQDKVGPITMEIMMGML